MQSQIAFLLNQQVMMQQNMSTMATDMKSAFREIMVQVQKPAPLVEQEILLWTSTRMGDILHPPPLLEPAVSYVVPPRPPLPQYIPPITTAPPPMLSVPVPSQFLQPPPFVPQQLPPLMNTQLIQNLQHLVGPGHGVPVGQNTVDSTPGDLLLGHIGAQVGMGTRGEQLQLTINASSGVAR